MDGDLMSRRSRRTLALALAMGPLAQTGTVSCSSSPSSPFPPPQSSAERVGAFVVNESFNTLPTGAEPDGWTIHGLPQTVAVAEVPFAANKSVALSTAGASGSATATIGFAPLSGRVVVEAKVKAMTAAGHAYLPAVLGADGVTPVVRVSFDGGDITSSPAGTPGPVQTFDAGTWYIVRVVVDTTASTYDLYIDGARVLAGAALQVKSPSVAGVTFAVSGDASSSYVDDVRVYELGAFIGPPPPPVVDAKTLGATGDGVTNDTAALQEAIDSVPASGGSVYVHDGTFVTGTLRLKSNLTLYIDPTAVLEGSSDVADFPAQSPPTQNVNLADCRRALVYVEGATNVTIDGGGTIDGNGSLSQYGPKAGRPEDERPIMFWPVQTSNLVVRNVRFHDGAVWGVVPTECSRVTIDNVYIDTTGVGNRDGIDVVDSSDVTIEHTVLHTEDDAICPKSGVAAGVRNLVVHDTAITGSSHANGIKFGTVSYGAFADSTFTDVLVKNVEMGGISVESADGADVANITFQRIEVDRSGAPLFVLIENRGETPIGSPRKIGTVDGLRYVDIRATRTRSSDGSALVGLTLDGVRHPLKNLSFENVSLDFPGGVAKVPRAPREPGAGYPEFNMFGALPAAGYYFRHVDGLTFANDQTSVAAPDARPAAAFVDVTRRSGAP
jgi:polygalacturonase